MGPLQKNDAWASLRSLTAIVLKINVQQCVNVAALSLSQMASHGSGVWITVPAGKKYTVWC